MTRHPTDTITTSFDSLPWHDAELQELIINRRASGVCDEVRLQVVWPDGGRAALLFRECYGFAAEMNFGVIAQEQIAAASTIPDDPHLVSLRDSWKLLGRRWICCAVIGLRPLRQVALFESMRWSLRLRT